MDASRIEMALLRRALDIGVTARETRSDQLLREPFIWEPVELLMHPLNPLARFDVVPREALANQTLIMREHGSRTRQVVEGYITTHGLRFARIIEASGIEGATEAIIRNKGVGFGLVFPNQIELEAGQLVSRRVEGVTGGIRFDLVYRSKDKLSPLAIAFISCCRQILNAQQTRSSSLVP